MAHCAPREREGEREERGKAGEGGGGVGGARNFPPHELRPKRKERRRDLSALEIRLKALISSPRDPMRQFSRFRACAFFIKSRTRAKNKRTRGREEKEEEKKTEQVGEKQKLASQLHTKKKSTRTQGESPEPSPSPFSKVSPSRKGHCVGLAPAFAR